ncbi:MAG: AMP-binding protein [Acidobacteria bacterium]|uniref:AMP-binding protein n=1 Tax=Candidatus Polarisedimenticola svalbardensis TaxID=2886004 RepID=A0A8J7CF16_9BACT|nr:AMP-binding protein [Candidatus Polarisedimenticola svalbardensis]
MKSDLVHQFLETWVAADPEAILVTERDGNKTYSEVETGANRIARILVDCKLRKGDRVALIAPNSSLYIEAYYGILKAGGIVVALDAGGDLESQAARLADCTPTGIICSGPQVRRGLQLAARLDLGFVLSLDVSVPAARSGLGDATLLIDGPEALPASGAEPLNLQMDPGDRAAIVYTSGSTGKPRGVILSHRNLVANTVSINSYLGLTAADSILAVLPFHYVYGKSLLNTHVAAGGRVVIENRFLYPQEALNTMEQQAVSGFSGVPSTFAILLNKSNFEQRELPALRYVTQAGGAMAPAMQERLLKAIPGKEIYIMYGATEASARLSYLPPSDLKARVGSIGKAIPGVELTVRRDDGTVAGPDEVGELVARGDNIMEGYWNAPAETAEVLTDLGYHTGDLARRDTDGFLYIVGRSREMIKSGAHRISPKEIEEAIARNPTVDEVAVKGVADEMLGESIHAFITLRAGRPCSEREIQEWCRGQIAPHKTPHQVHFIETFPRNASGKIDKLALSSR